MSIANINESNAPVKLTVFPRRGCGCKIAPKMLEEILRTNLAVYNDKRMLVGNSTRDDAAVYDIGNGQALISTTDFFMPIVDDAFDFGRIASANAISDVYAMGGTPLMAVAILGWPVEKLPADLARAVLEGARNICAQAGIPLAGGHSIDSTEPIFGLAVTGIINIENLKQNDTSAEGDFLFLTKPIGVGILSTAQKRGLLKEEHNAVMVKQMTALNTLGESLGKMSGVSAMTDVTGFGLLGHMIEMCEGAGLSAELFYSQVPVITGAREYLAQKLYPMQPLETGIVIVQKVGFEKGVNVMEAFSLLPDPQTNGGLLFSVKPSAIAEIQELLDASGLKDFQNPIGRFTVTKEKVIEVKI